MIFSNIFTNAILISLAVASPNGGRPVGKRGGRESRMKAFEKRNPAGPAITAPFTSGTDSSLVESSSQNQAPPPSGSDLSDGDSPAELELSSPAAAAGHYAVANVTIHQYSLFASTGNDNGNSQIGEDISLWVTNMDHDKPNFATEAFCNLTWVASTANPPGPPATGQMACASREPNSTAVSKGLANYSAKWNVTFQQQTESPLSGFNLMISSSSMMGTRNTSIWAPRNLSSDPAWQINENYFQFPGLVSIGKASSSQTLMSRSSSDIPNDEIKVSDLTNNTTADAAANGHGSAPNVPNDHIKVADLNNKAIANEVAGASPPVGAASNDQIKVSDLNNHTIANEAANVPSPEAAVPNDQIQVSDLRNKDVANAAANAPSDTTATSNDQIQVSDLRNEHIANAAANPPPERPSNPSDQIQVADLTNKSIASKAVNPVPTPPSSVSTLASSTSTAFAQD